MGNCKVIDDCHGNSERRHYGAKEITSPLLRNS